MITLSILIVIALICAFVGCLMGLFSLVGLLVLLGSFVGEFLFGIVGIHATGSFSSFVISILGACVCIWVDNKLFKKG